MLDARDRMHNGKTVCLVLEFLQRALEVGSNWYTLAVCRYCGLREEHAADPCPKDDCPELARAAVEA